MENGATAMDALTGYVRGLVEEEMSRLRDSIMAEIGEKVYLLPTELARRCHVTLQTVYNWRRLKIITFTKIDGKEKIALREMDKLQYNEALGKYQPKKDIETKNR